METPRVIKNAFAPENRQALLSGAVGAIGVGVGIFTFKALGAAALSYKLVAAAAVGICTSEIIADRINDACVQNMLNSLCDEFNAEPQTK